MATIRQIAREAGVSVGTVSNVLNRPSMVSPETRERVLNVMRRHNYRPSLIARGLATGETRTFGLIVSDVLNPFAAGLAQGASEAARDLGCCLLVASATYDGHDVQEQIDALVHHWVDGIFMASQPLPEEMYDQLRFGETPVVIMDYRLSLPENVVGLVSFDWRGAAYQATRHMLDLGHRRIGYVGGIPDRSSSLLRKEGYCLALTEANIPLDPNLTLDGNYLTEGGHRCALELLRRSYPPTALVMANDMMALGAYQAAAGLDLRIARDVSIVGIDDDYFVAYLSPPLTTVHVPTRQLGRLGLRMLAETPNADAPLRRTTLPTALVVRRSTAPYRGHHESEAR